MKAEILKRIQGIKHKVDLTQQILDRQNKSANIKVSTKEINYDSSSNKINTKT